MRQLEDFSPNLYTSTPDYTCIITFNEETFVDKTQWTIRSHFALLIVLLASAIKLHSFPHHKEVSAHHGCWSRKHVVERLAPAFLFMEALSHGFAGIYHLVVKSAEEEAHPLESLSQMFGMLASVIFFLFALMVVMSTRQKLSRLVGLVWRFGIICLWLGVIYAYMFEGTEVFLGIDLHMYVLVGVSGLLLLAYGIRIFHTRNGNICHFFSKSLSLLVIILATAYAYNVYRKCGSYNGYLECFIRCPLPGGLNHTSFYNIAKLLALGGWAMAEDIHPSVSLYQLTLGLRTDEVTVMSDGDSDLDKEDEDDEDHLGMDGMEGMENQDGGEHDIEANDIEARNTSAMPNVDTRPTHTEEPKNTGEMVMKIDSISSPELQPTVVHEADHEVIKEER